MTTTQHAIAAIRQGARMIALTAMLGLAACNGDAETAASETNAAVSQGMTITNARLVLPPVAGNPAAVYFDLSYTGDQNPTLSSVAVEGAGMTMIHDYGEAAGKMQMMEAQPIVLTTGTPVTFAPGGLHVMAMQPSADWQPGGTVKVTLTLSDGSSQSFDAQVRAAGEER